LDPKTTAGVANIYIGDRITYPPIFGSTTKLVLVLVLVLVLGLELVLALEFELTVRACTSLVLALRLLA